MHIWFDLILRELLFLALLTALGSGPAAFLSDRFAFAARITMAPVLGLCAGACVTVTLAEFYAAQQTRWVVVAAAVLSVTVATWRRPRRRAKPQPVGLIGVGLVVVVVLAAFSYPLVHDHAVGPIGGYQIADTSGYVSETDSLQHYSLRSARQLVPPYKDLSAGALANYGRGTQQIDISALEANYDSLLGLGATDTQSAFLIAVLLTGALGAFSVVVHADRRAVWAATLAGCLFAGPVFVELVMEGSQAAIAGAAVLAPIVALGVDSLRRPKVGSLILLGLAAAGLQTMYPLFVPSIVIGALLVLGAAAVLALRARRLRPRVLANAAAALGLVLLCSIAFTPVAFSRNATYWSEILRGTFSFVGLPVYNLPAAVVPGWLLQTRDFYGLVNPFVDATAGQIALSVVVPIAFLATIALGAWRHRVVKAMVAVAAGAVLLAYYTWTKDHCSYCVQRNLLPVAILAPTALSLGLSVLSLLSGKAGVGLAAVVALVAVLVVGHEGIVLRQRLTQGDYVLDNNDRQAISALPRPSGPLLLEGFSESSQAPMELPLVYNLANEASHGDVALPTATNDNSGLEYLIGTAAPLGPSFVTNYQYVLTRLAGIATARRTVARYGSIALERRVRPLDVTLISGGAVPSIARLDPTGIAWVTPRVPLQFLVVGAGPSTPTWVALRLHATVPVKVVPGPGLVSHRLVGGDLRVCVRAPGNSPVRAATLTTAFVPQPPPAPPGPYYRPLPARGLSLQSMVATSRSCAGT